MWPTAVHGAAEISIHAPREGCDEDTELGIVGRDYISIHAPREGCDVPDSAAPVIEHTISIHAPREGCDEPTGKRYGGECDFNPRTP